MAKSGHHKCIIFYGKQNNTTTGLNKRLFLSKTIQYKVGSCKRISFYGNQNNTTSGPPKILFMESRTVRRRPFRRQRPLSVLHPSSVPSSLSGFLHPPPVRCPSRRRRPLSVLRPSAVCPVFVVVFLRSSIVRPVFVVVVFCPSVACCVVVVLCPSSAGADQLLVTQRFVSAVTSA